MLKPNCIIATIAPEATLKSFHVRKFIEKKLRENIRTLLKNKKIKVELIENVGSRFVISCEQPKDAFLALKKCFGIYGLSLAQKETLVELGEISEKAGEISDFHDGSFAVKGKSYSTKFKSKQLEEECGGKILEKNPKLKVNLSKPDNTLFCITSKTATYYYIEKVLGAKGMPVGSQGRVEIISPNEKLGWLLMKNGCSITADKKLDKLKEWNSLEEIKLTSIEKAKTLYTERKITAFFTAETNQTKIDEISKKLGTKVFAPLILEKTKTPFD